MVKKITAAIIYFFRASKEEKDMFLKDLDVFLGY